MAEKTKKSKASATRNGSAATGGEGDPVIIKKYANRRLYDTRSSRYVTLEDLAEMVRDGDDFMVLDAKTGEDLTRPVLTQIIFEAEAKGANMLPTGFLRHVIKFYGDSLQSLLPDYLEHTMAAFSGNQTKLREQLTPVGSMFGLQQWEDIGRRNMELFERAAEIFSPFGAGLGAGDSQQPPAAGDRASDQGDEGAPTGDRDEQLDALKAQLDTLQAQLNTLTRGGGKS